MGLENIKHTPIKYDEVNKKPYFSSILESTKNLLESCIDEKNKLLNKMKNNNGNPPNIKDIVDYMLLCYLWPELKLQNVNKCANEYNKIIKNVLKSRNYKLKKIKALSETLATDNSNNGSKGALIHAIQSFPRVELLCKELEKVSKKEHKLEVDVLICPNLWKELSSCGESTDWSILKKVFEINDIYASSLNVWCSKRIKELFNDSSEGIGYFKNLYHVTNEIAAGRTEISEITHKEEACETNKSETKTTNKKENDFGNDKFKTTNEGEKNSKRSTFRISNSWKRHSISKTNTTNKEISTSECKKSSKNSKSRMSNILKRLSGSMTKTKE